MSTFAAFIALGGSGYAAIELGPDAVRNRNIAPGAVNSPKLRDNSVRSRDVRNGSLRRRDFRPGDLPTRPPLLEVTAFPGWPVPTAFIPVAVPGVRLDLPKRPADEAWALTASVQLDGAGAEIVCDLSPGATPPSVDYSQETLREGASSLAVIGRTRTADRASAVVLRCALRPDEPISGPVGIVHATLRAQAARYGGPEQPLVVRRSAIGRQRGGVERPMARRPRMTCCS